MSQHLCIFPLCPYDAVHDEFCFRHKKLSSVPEVKDKKRKPIAPRSKKKIKENKLLAPKYAAFLAKEENQVCNIQIDEGCTYFATVVNHTRRRGANVDNEEDWEASCAYCNIAIEQQDKWARENGHLKSKFNNE